MLFKKIFIVIILSLFYSSSFANTPKSTGKYKKWESFAMETDKGKICLSCSVLGIHVNSQIPMR